MIHNIKKRIKGLIFDLDGTVIQSNIHWHNATRKVLAEYGYDQLTPAQEQVLLSVSGMHLEKAITTIRDAFLLSDDIETLAKKKQVHALAQFTPDHTKFIDGFIDFHDIIRKHQIASGIATNADTQSLTQLKTSLKLDNFFGTHIYSFMDVAHKAKPDPALFLHTAKQLGCDPTSCVVFEDSLQGFLAAEAAGMKCIAIKHATNEEHRHKTHAAIDSYHDAIDALQSLV